MLKDLERVAHAMEAVDGDVGALGDDELEAVLRRLAHLLTGVQARWLAAVGAAER